MPEDWSDLRGQHDRDLRKRSDDRIQALEDDRGRVHGRGTPQNGNGIARFLWILVAGMVTLALGGIVGGIVMYRDMGVQEAKIDACRAQAEQNRQRIEWLFQQVYSEQRRRER